MISGLPKHALDELNFDWLDLLAKFSVKFLFGDGEPLAASLRFFRWGTDLHPIVALKLDDRSHYFSRPGHDSRLHEY